MSGRRGFSLPGAQAPRTRFRHDPTLYGTAMGWTMPVGELRILRLNVIEFASIIQLNA